MDDDVGELRALGDRIRVAVGAARARGWRHADLERVLARDGNRRAADLFAHVADGPLRWAQRRGVRPRDAVQIARFLAIVIELLPPLPVVGDNHVGDLDAGMVAKVRALLAKAESTTYPAEAEALTAKAYELMDRYAIDQLMLAGDSRNGVGARRVLVDDPYARAKFVLLGTVARACRCRSVWWSGLGLATVFGFGADVDTVILLYESLMVQAASGMQVVSRDVPAVPGRKAAFRRAYLLGFADTIGARLRATHDSGVAEAVRQYGDSVLPVLASQHAAVDAAVDALGKIKPVAASSSDGAGWVAGATAAERASLVGRGSLPGVPRAIGR